jgi:hypothetical protein
MTTKIQKRKPTSDSIMLEVRRTKERLASQYGFDVRRIAVAARMAQESSGRTIVRKRKD